MFTCYNDCAYVIVFYTCITVNNTCFDIHAFICFKVKKNQRITENQIKEYIY